MRGLWAVEVEGCVWAEIEVVKVSVFLSREASTVIQVIKLKPSCASIAYRARGRRHVEVLTVGKRVS